jgi:hypothetical protein
MKNLRLKLMPILVFIAVIYNVWLVYKGYSTPKYIFGTIFVIIGSCLNYIVSYYNNWKMPVIIPKIFKPVVKFQKSERHVFYFNKSDTKIKLKFLGDNFMIIPVRWGRILSISIGDILIALGFLRFVF